MRVSSRVRVVLLCSTVITCFYITTIVFFFFFQAEDGIRDLTVTGVQTCALPICDVEDNQNKAQHLPLLALEVKGLESQVLNYDRQFPKQADLGDFIKDMTRVSQQLALHEWKYQPAAPKRGDAYFELPIQMNFQGEFLNGYSFFTEVRHL